LSKKTEQELSVYRDHLEELVKTRTEELDKANKFLRIEIQKELAEFLETLGVAKEDLLVNGKYDIMLFEKQQIK